MADQKADTKENQGKDHGELTDASLSKGPREERGCTDIICCLLFILFSVAMLGVAVTAFKNGDPQRLAQPYDPNHRPCGVDPAVADAPFIYFTTLYPAPLLYRTLCVKQCPTADNVQSGTLNCVPNDQVKDCQASILPGPNQVLIYPSVPYAGRICIPNDPDMYKKVKDALQVDKAQVWITDFRNTWMIVTGSAVLAVILSYIFFLFLRIGAGCVVWGFLILILIGFLGLGGFFYMRAYKLEQAKIATTPTTPPQITFLSFQQTVALEHRGNKLAEREIEEIAMTRFLNHLAEDASTNNGSSNTDDMEKQADDPKKLKLISYVFFGLALIYLIILCCSMSRIKLAVAVLKCSARFMMDNRLLLLIPPITFVVCLLYFGYWMTVTLYLYSSGEVSKQPKQLPFGQFEMNDTLKQMMWAHVFELCWVMAFLAAANQFIIMGTACYWYFDQDHSLFSFSKVFRSTYILFRYHIGTVAFGSLIIAILDFIQIVLEYFAQQAKRTTDNKVLMYVIRCLQCCVWCVEKCMNMINKNAYIVTIMQGANYCSAAKKSIQLIWRNPLRFSTVAGMGAVFEILGKLAICLSSTFICYTVITKVEWYTSRLSSPIVPTVLFLILSFTVASFFMSLYGTSADTIIVVFTMDEEMAKGRGAKAAAHCPAELKQFMEEAAKD